MTLSNYKLFIIIIIIIIDYYYHYYYYIVAYNINIDEISL